MLLIVILFIFVFETAYWHFLAWINPQYAGACSRYLAGSVANWGKRKKIRLWREKNACYLHGVNLLSRAVMINLQSKQKQLVLNLISTLTDKVQEFINFIGLNSSCQ